LTNFFQTLRRKADATEHGWPNYLFGGRMRTSTLVLVIAFLAAWWIYDDHEQDVRSRQPTTTQVPATQVVPPGYVPDPSYTWVPRSRVQEPPTTTTPTPTPTPTPTTTTPSPPFGLPPLPPLPTLPPPFGPPPSSATSPPPGPEPSPTPAPAPALPGLPPPP
jgi:hypothetical protein